MESGLSPSASKDVAHASAAPEPQRAATVSVLLTNAPARPTHLSTVLCEPGLAVYLLLALAVLGRPAAALAAPESAVDFRTQIQPIFAAACVSCHGPEKQKGGLRLDVKALAMDGGDVRQVDPPRTRGQEPARPARCAATGTTTGCRSRSDPLSGREQIALMPRWIDQGAPWPDGGRDGGGRAKHWSFDAARRGRPSRR